LRKQLSIPFSFIPVQDPHKIYDGNEENMWAEPEVAAAAEALAKLELDRELARRIGYKAHQVYGIIVMDPN
jgi:hypothetical protein